MLDFVAGRGDQCPFGVTHRTPRDGVGENQRDHTLVAVDIGDVTRPRFRRSFDRVGGDAVPRHVNPPCFDDFDPTPIAFVFRCRVHAK